MGDDEAAGAAAVGAIRAGAVSVKQLGIPYGAATGRAEGGEGADTTRAPPSPGPRSGAGAAGAAGPADRPSGTPTVARGSAITSDGANDGAATCSVGLAGGGVWRSDGQHAERSQAGDAYSEEDRGVPL